MKENDVEELSKLIGDITDYKSEISENDDEDNQTNPGSFIEKYFNAKLQKQLNATLSFPNTKIIVSELLDEMIIKINDTVINKNLDTSKAFNLIKQLKYYLKGEAQIEIDSMFSMIPGKTINEFFNKTSDFSFPDNLVVDDNRKYTIIIESTFNLSSQIIKKVDQVRKSFLLFSVLDYLYKKYPVYLEEYYLSFIKKYILRDKLDKKENNIIANNYNLSDFGNYIFLITSNSKFKSFKDIEIITEKFPYDASKIIDSVKKCFNYCISDDRTNKLSQIKPKAFKDDELIEKKIAGIKKNTDLSNAYNTLKYLVANINYVENCKFKILYLDTYLNLMSPKCFLIEKIEKYQNKLKIFNENINQINNKYQRFEEENIKLKENVASLKDENSELKENVDLLNNFIKSKFPEFNLSRLKKK